MIAEWEARSIAAAHGFTLAEFKELDARTAEAWLHRRKRRVQLAAVDPASFRALVAAIAKEPDIL